MIHKYKRFILSIIISLWALTSWAQDPMQTWVLNTEESSTTKNYMARESITLQSTGTGFHFKAEGGKTFSAKIDAGLLFPPNDKTYAITASNGTITYNSTNGSVVGIIPGSVSVSPTGAANYQIPIEVPSGVNGLQPNVSIVYNSQGGFGSLGMGWDIAGGSAITRGAKSIYYDKTIDIIKFDNSAVKSDALYLDGQRLILLSGNPFTSSATYGTEVENYARVVYNGSGFVVTTKDGKIMEYGNSTTSLLKNANDAYDPRVLAWKLNKVSDTYGNTMTYTYSDYGQYLQKIDYVGQSVEFAYNQLLDVPKKSYITTFLVTQSKLLSSIITKSGTTTLKTFGFIYTNDNRLTTVNETASDNSKVNSTTINWGAESKGITQVVESDNPDPNLGTNKGSVYSADVNGDGYPDRIELCPGVNCENLNNMGHVVVRLYNPLSKQFNSIQDGNYSFCPDDNLSPKLTTGDIDNDGKDEIILFKKDWLVVLGLAGNSLYEIHPSINLDLNSIHQGYNKDRNYQIFTTSVNNDKYPDVVMVFGYHFDGFTGLSDQRAGYTVFIGGETGLTKVYDKSFNTDNSFEEFKIGDFNADGKIDVVGKVSYNRITSNWDSSKSYDNNYIDFYTDLYSFSPSTFPDPTCGKYTIDFNGDGIPETLYQVSGDNGSASYLWGFGNPSSLSIVNCINPSNSESYPKETYQMYPIDYNGDGLVDLIQGDEITLNDNSIVTNWHFYKNTGKLNYQWENTIQTNCRLNSQTVFVADINGDGIADLVFPTATKHCFTDTICPPGVDPNPQPLLMKGVSPMVIKPVDPGCTTTTTCYTTYEYSAFTMPNANRRNIVTGITNGMGQTNSFTYKNFSVFDQTATNGVVRNLKVPLLVVDTHTEPDGSVTGYTFEKPKVHTEGKGFLGFSTVTDLNTDKNAKIVSIYGYETTYYSTYLLYQDVTTAVGNTPISSSVQTNSLITIDAARKCFIPIVTQQIVTDQFKGVEQKTVTNYSKYPNSLSQTATIKNSSTGTVDLTTTVVTTFTGPSGVTPYLPLSITSTRTQGGQSDSTKVKYVYTWDTGNIYKLLGSTETTNPENEAYKIVTETSNPDAWGHMQTVAVKAKDQTGVEISRGSSVSYFASGRLVASKTNLLGETTSYDWGDKILGQLKSETTTIGSKAFTTNYTYNSRGDLLETRYPDGNRKTAVIQWAGTGGVSGAVYYTYSETSGSAPIKVWHDVLGREIQKDSYGLNGNKISVSTEYYTSGVNKGKVLRVSELHFENKPFNWAATYGYNATYGYAENVITPMGTTHTAPVKLTTSVTTPEGTSATTTNAAGQTLSSTVNGKKVSYEYYPNGLTKRSMPEGGQAITMKYNPQGKRTVLVDPDGGTIRTEFNGWGELTKEVQLIHLNKDSIITLNKYDSFGRLLSINRNTEITTYTYDTGNKSRVNSIAIAGKNSQAFVFDDFDRVKSVTETITANGTTKTFVTGKEYDPLGRLKKEIFPSGYYTVNNYDQYSNLKEVKDGVGHSIWKAGIENALGQATSIFKGTKETMYEYDPINHLKTSIKANGIVDYTYGYDSKNNLSWRKDNLTTQQEDFGYDALNRLTSWKVTRARVQTPYGITYDPANLANIQTKSGIETDPQHLLTMFYGGKNPDGTTTGRPNGSLIGPHALSTISGVPASPFPQTDLIVTYTDFKKIATLDEGTKHYDLAYGVDDERRMSVYKESGIAKLSRYYLGNYEEEIYPDGKVRKIHYLSGAILIQNEGKADSLLYTYSDAQGSLIALTDADGGIVRKYAYDPWGARRDTSNWNLKDNGDHLIVNRGYTGHEHLDAFAIINMNGRVYDPLTAQFFSPDPVLQAPGDWLNYNRYTYCMNNPFKYTDPSGEFFFLIPNIGWSKNGGLSIGLTAIVGIPGIISAQASVGYSFKSNDFSATVGATALFNTVYLSYSSQSGFSTGWSVGLSPQMGLPISTNFFSMGANYNITHDSWSGNISAWGVDKNGWTFNPSVSVMIFPEHTTNFVRGKGFNSNDKVLYNFIHGYNDKDWSDDIGTEGANWYSAALKYFGIKGKYQKEPPGNNSNVEGNTTYYGATSPSTGQMYFGDLAFSSFDNLQQTYYKENFTSQRVQNRQKLAISNDSSDNKYYPEEALGFEYAYKNSGLYPNATVKSYQLANSYWFQVFGVTLINHRNPLYSIPRLW